MMKRRVNNPAAIVLIIILAAFLLIGLSIFRNYGSSNDELNQVEAGHITWKFLCQKFGVPVPKEISEAPELQEYFNRYYGQAATFPTVVVEAVRGFKLDISTILVVRHLWNFLCYFAGLCCFTVLLYRIFPKPWCAPVGLVFMILLPRIFGDIFYNDRDTMLIAWLMISLAALHWHMETSRWYSGLICAFAFAVAINTRLFGLILFVFTLLYIFDPPKRKNVLLLIFLSIVFWILLSPVYWGNPFKIIPESIYYLTRKQREIDTNNGWAVLFLGRYFNERQLPWYYIPLYILISTPLATTLMSVFGTCVFIRRFFFSAKDGWTPRKIFGSGMLILLGPFLVLVILFRPSLYNGWRHFYFLYLPIVWMSVEGIDYLLDLPARAPVRILSFIITGISFIVSVVWMINIHPYQGIYMTPVIRKQFLGKFEGDYWNISASECMEYLLDHSVDYAIHVTGNNWLYGAISVFPPADRDRFHIYPLKTQPYPFEYLYYNYYNDISNDVSFNYYIPVFSVVKDGVKLAEIFQRSHTNELNNGIVAARIYPYGQDTEIDVITDNDHESYWSASGNPLDLVIQLNEDYTLLSIELFPLNHLSGIPDFRLLTSEDGVEWTSVPYTKGGDNGLIFGTAVKNYLRLQCDAADFGIREILLYGY